MLTTDLSFRIIPRTSEPRTNQPYSYPTPNTSIPVKAVCNPFTNSFICSFIHQCIFSAVHSELNSESYRPCIDWDSVVSLAPSRSTLPLFLHSSPLALLLFLKHTKQSPAPQTLYLFFYLPGKFFPQIAIA